MKKDIIITIPPVEKAVSLMIENKLNQLPITRFRALPVMDRLLCVVSEIDLVFNAEGNMFVDDIIMIISSN